MIYFSVLFRNLIFISIWEGIKNILLRKKRKTPKKGGTMNTICEIKKELTNEPKKDTVKNWMRKCPRCKKYINYKNKKCYRKSVLQNKLCHVCSISGKKHVVLNTKHRLNGKIRPRECPSCSNIITYKNERQRHLAIHRNGICRKCASINREYKLNKDTRKDFDIIDGKIMYYRFCPNCNDKIYYKSPSHRNQLRDKKCICRKCFKLDKFVYPNFNKSACLFFDTLNKENNWNLQHALNGGEFYVDRLHYFLDAYDKEKNIVVEWYEKHHFNTDGSIKKKDLGRIDDIIKSLQCRFIGYNHKGNKIIDEPSTISVKSFNR